MVSELAAALALMASPATPATAVDLPTLEAFEAVLRRNDSATLALEEWCALRGIADPAQITAQTLPTKAGDATEAMRAKLAIGPGEMVALRNVKLSCGDTVLSVAWNWYVPARLTPQMNHVLGTTTMPFGKVVAPLHFRRRPLATVAGPAENCPPDTISTHQAMLVLPDGRPLAYLVECYTAANLASR